MTLLIAGPIFVAIDRFARHRSLAHLIGEVSEQEGPKRLGAHVRVVSTARQHAAAGVDQRAPARARV